MLVGSALFAAFSFFFYAPCAVYFPNAEEFAFTFADFWVILLGCTLFSATLLTGIGLLLKRTQKIYCACLLAFGISVYLQGSFLAEDLGAFNGLPYLWRDSISHIVLDGFIWLMIAMLCVLIAVKTKKNGRKLITCAATAGFLFLTLTSLLLIGSSKKEYLHSRQFFVSDRNLFSVSEDRNVIILVLDMFDNDYMETIAGDSPELLEELDGFTWFSNTVSVFGATNYSLGSFLSGAPMLNQQPSYAETLNANAESDSFFPTLVENGWDLEIYTEAKYIPDLVAANAENCLIGKGEIINIPAFCGVMYRMAACSFLPDAVRPFIWLSGTEFDGLYGRKNSDDMAFTIATIPFFRKVQSQSLSLQSIPCFRLIHLFGAHYPYTMNENLQPIPPSYSDENAIRAAKASLKVTLLYLNKLKELGIYDDALIIVMGDHGYSVDGGLTNPMLMIHRPEQDEPFAVSRVPASFIDLPKTILSALSLRTDNISGEDLFTLQEGQSRERLYYQMFDAAPNGQSRLVEYSVAPEGNARKYYTLTDREISSDGRISCHSDNCSCCRENGMEPIDAPNNISILH